MQTFLPYEDFEHTASVLDWRRLGKQRVETLQILRTLAGESRGWKAHPAVRMWRGWEHLLVDYGLVVCAEWRLRGYVENCARVIAQFDLRFHTQRDGRRPPWLGAEDFHRSHRSNLLRKDASWYREFWPDERDDLPYVWPVSTTTVCFQGRRC